MFKGNQKFYVSLVIVLLCLLLGAICIILSATAADGQAETEYIKYVVDRGDTLWDIATEYGNGIRTDKLVYKIRKFNGIDDCVIYPGEVIYIPYN